MDLLVVVQGFESRRKATVAVYHALTDLLVAKDILVAAEDELESLKESFGTVFPFALAEGRVLYEQPEARPE